MSEIMCWEGVLVGFPHLLCYPRGSLLLPAGTAVFGLKVFGSRGVPWVLFAQVLLVILIPDPKGSGPGSHIRCPHTSQRLGGFMAGEWMRDMGIGLQAQGRQEALGDGDLRMGPSGLSESQNPRIPGSCRLETPSQIMESSL